MKKVTLKRFAMTSTAVLLSLSLLNTAPGLYKGAQPLSVIHASDTDSVKTLLTNVYGELKGDTTLRGAYSNALTNIDYAASRVNSSVLANLPAGISVEKRSALRNLLGEVIAFAGVATTSYDSLPADLVAAINNVNNQFDFDTDITVDDTASLVKAAQESVLHEFESKTLIDLLQTDLNLINFIVDAFSSELSATEHENNSFVGAVKEIYDPSDIDDVVADLGLLKTALLSKLTSDQITEVKDGGYALAIAYLKHGLKADSAYESSKSNNIYTLEGITVNDVSIPFFALKFSSSTGALVEKQDEITLDLRGKSSDGTAQLTAKLSGFVVNELNLDKFKNVELLSRSITYTATVNNNIDNTVVENNNPGVVTIVNGPTSTASEEDVLLSTVAVSNAVLATDNATYNQFIKQASEALVVTAVIPNNGDTGGNVKFSLGTSELSALESLKKLKDDYTNKLGDTNASEMLKATYVLNASSSNGVEGTISKEAIAQLLSYGITNIEIVTSTASLNMSIMELSDSVNVRVGEPTTLPIQVIGEGVYTGISVILPINTGGVYDFKGTSLSFSNIYANSSVSRFSNDLYSDSLYNFASLAAVTTTQASTFNPDEFVIVRVVGDKVTYIGGKYNPKTDSIEVNIKEEGDYFLVKRSVSFEDSNTLSWATSAINRGATKGFYQGKGDGKFHVSANVTKAEFIAMLLRTQNLTASEKTKQGLKFTDVNPQQWYYDIAAAAIQYGLVSADDKQFNAGHVLTREEVATLASTFLVEILGYDTKFTKSDIFKKDQHEIASKNLSSVNLLGTEGIIKGKSDGVFAPKAKVTRAEAAVIIDRIFDL